MPLRASRARRPSRYTWRALSTARGYIQHRAEGSRVADALTKAGGPTGRCPSRQHQPRSAAERWREGHSPAAKRHDTGTGRRARERLKFRCRLSSLININTATVDELDRLPGVGPSLAKQIVDYRQKYGQFASVEELDNVPGIDPAKLDSLKDLVTI